MQADAPMESYTIVCKNRSYGRVVRFSYESVQDAKKTGNILAQTVGTWGRMLPTTKEKFYANFFLYGAYTAGRDATFDNSITGVVTDSSGDFIYDGDPWFSTTHTSKAGTDYVNYSTSTTLTHTNLQTVYLTYTSTNNRDERDEIIALSPDVLLIPPALGFTAAAILQSTLIPGSMDNDTNVLKNILTPMEWHYINSESTGWFLGKKKMGIMATDREDVSLDFWQDETSKDYFASIFTRFGGCVTNWRLTNQSLPESKGSENNRVNCWKTLMRDYEDNQQPSLSRNTFEGSTTSSQPQTDNAVGSNGTMSALLPFGMMI